MPSAARSQLSETRQRLRFDRGCNGTRERNTGASEPDVEGAERHAAEWMDMKRDRVLLDGKPLVARVHAKDLDLHSAMPDYLVTG
jgi:hypothetical protein